MNMDGGSKSPASLRRRGMPSAPLKLFPTDYDALETAPESPAPTAQNNSFGQMYPQPVSSPQLQRAQQPAPTFGSPQPIHPHSASPVLAPQSPGLNNPYSVSASPPVSPSVSHRPLRTISTPPHSPVIPRHDPSTSITPTSTTKQPPSPKIRPKTKPLPPLAVETMKQLKVVSRVAGVLSLFTFGLYVFAYCRDRRSLVHALEFFLTGDIFLAVAGIGMLLCNSTLIGKASPSLLILFGE